MFASESTTLQGKLAKVVKSLQPMVCLGLCEQGMSTHLRTLIHDVKQNKMNKLTLEINMPPKKGPFHKEMSSSNQENVTFRGFIFSWYFLNQI